jgi:hypothetical protein
LQRDYLLGNRSGRVARLEVVGTRPFFFSTALRSVTMPDGPQFPKGLEACEQRVTSVFTLEDKNAVGPLARSHSARYEPGANDELVASTLKNRVWL